MLYDIELFTTFGADLRILYNIPEHIHDQIDRLRQRIARQCLFKHI